MLKMMAPSTMKVKVVALPEGKHPVGTREILDKTTVDPEEETAGVQKALMVIQAPERGVQYISLVPVATTKHKCKWWSTFNWHCSQQRKPRNAPEPEVTTSSLFGISHNDPSR